MRRSLVLALALGFAMLTPRVLPAQETPTFADLAWGSSRDSAKSALVAKGYTFVEEDSDHDLQFRTTVLQQLTAVYLMFNPHGELVKVYVVLATPDAAARGVYKQMVDVLSDKYGDPTMRVENFEAPYQKGDGSEDEAIKAGKATLATIWTPKAKVGYGISCRVTVNLAVGVSYEPSTWHEEFERRSRNSTRDF
ncbi:MAG TPA: hypothetical protein VFK13_01165 [Gemmatimonadaceae bacterium]|nr:hypothetical protein [Gemmatimonadaceae bacterium]